MNTRPCWRGTTQSPSRIMSEAPVAQRLSSPRTGNAVSRVAKIVATTTISAAHCHSHRSADPEFCVDSIVFDIVGLLAPWRRSPLRAAFSFPYCRPKPLFPRENYAKSGTVQQYEFANFHGRQL